jgi:hypothetical protein
MAQKNLVERSKPKAVSLLVDFESALCVKAIAGPADHTARFARGAKPQEPRPQVFGRTATSGGDPATMKLAAASGETAGGCETSEQASSPADGSKTAKGIK